MDIKEIRRANARKLADQYETLAKFSAAIDRSPTQVSRCIGKSPTKNIGDALARHIETKLNKKRGWLDHRHDSLGEHISGEACAYTITKEALELAEKVTNLQISGQVSVDFIKAIHNLIDESANTNNKSKTDSELLRIQVMNLNANR